MKGTAFFTLPLLFLPLLFLPGCSDPTGWYEAGQENLPGLRWWWLGSAVDKDNLDFQLEEFASKGFGAVEITPLYGVMGNEANDIDYLSPRWMEMLSHCIGKGHSLGLEVDMSNCTGWPFGGPWIGVENAAKTFSFNTDTTEVVAVPTGQKVKRAAPGGVGFVMDHYSRRALDTYLAPFDRAFESSGCPWPDAFFNDSFEVYGAGWTEELPEAFFNDHGYRIEDHLKAFARNDGTPESAQVIADYRATLSDLYIRNFVIPWGEWSRSHGVPVRHQAHGSPANLVDVYAAADIPECEAFGQTPFDIKGLYRSGDTRLNDADPAVFKFASSASHVTGKPLTSCETLTWLTEHFNTSLSLCKPEIDLAFASGVNHVMLHGAPYSPRETAFPGWKFYATINLSPSNPSIWEVAKPLTDYISRCQAFLTQGASDADFLLYFPVHDIWHGQFPTQFMMLDIHKMHLSMPQFKRDVLDILSMGYDVDYISDALLKGVSVGRDGTLLTEGGTRYKALVLPSQTEHMPQATRDIIDALAAKGAKVLSFGDLPGCGIRPEPSMCVHGLHMVRRRADDGCTLYFVANLGPDDVNALRLSCDAEAVELFDPMTGMRGFARSERNAEGTDVSVELPSGASLLVKAFPRKPRRGSCGDWPYAVPEVSVPVDGPWTLDFLRSAPDMPQTHYDLDTLQGWHLLPGGSENEAVGVYGTTVRIDREGEWLLSLGQVRESAVVRINGVEAGTLIAAPFVLRIGRYLHEGDNRIEIEVRNLPANRIAAMDREGKVWRIFKDVNIAAVNSRQVVTYEKINSYGWWPTVPSGLVGPVNLIYCQ